MRYRCIVGMEPASGFYFAQLVLISIESIADNYFASKTKTVALFVVEFESGTIIFSLMISIHFERTV